MADAYQMVATVYQDGDPVAAPLGYITKRDPILLEAGMVFRGRYDPGFPFSYPGGPLAGRPAPAAPTNGQVIYDVAERANGSVVLQATDVVGFSRGGFDFTGVTRGGNVVQWPADTLTPMAAAGSQYFAVMFYARLPTQANWNAGATLAPVFTTTAGAAGYPGEADMLTIGQHSSLGLLGRRQTNGAGTIDTLAVIPDSTCYGKLCQIYFVRTSLGQTFVIRPVGGTALTATAAAGSDNTGDFSAKRPQFGPATAFQSGIMDAAHQNAAKWKLYDQTIISLAGGANPLVPDGNGKNLFDRDHDRVVALIAANAAANGGTSQIYN